MLEPDPFHAMDPEGKGELTLQMVNEWCEKKSKEMEGKSQAEVMKELVKSQTKKMQVHGAHTSARVHACLRARLHAPVCAHTVGAS